MALGDQTDFCGSSSAVDNSFCYSSTCNPVTCSVLTVVNKVKDKPSNKLVGWLMHNETVGKGTFHHLLSHHLERSVQIYRNV